MPWRRAWLPTMVDHHDGDLVAFEKDSVALHSELNNKLSCGLGDST